MVKPRHDEQDEEEDRLGPTEIITSHLLSEDFIGNFKDRGYSELQLWCKTPHVNTILIRLQHFPLTCYIELPKIIDEEEVEWSVNSNYLLALIAWFKNILKDDMFYEWELEFKVGIHYFKEARPMLKVSFHTDNHMRHCTNIINKMKNKIKIRDRVYELNVWEANIKAIRKLFTSQNAKFSQWMNISCQEIPLDHPERISVKGSKKYPIREYFGDWQSLVQLSDLEASTLVSYASWLVFDIETYSPNHRAMPKELKDECECYIVSCVFEIPGIANSRDEYAILIGPCDDIPGKKCIRVDSELELLNTYTDLIVKFDPDLITGYNIVSYDYPYMDTRLKMKWCEWKECGRIAGEKCYPKYDKLVSGAYGINKIVMLIMKGRSTVDMLQVIKRDYKLDNFKLDFVCHTFLKVGKHDVTASRMFEIYEQIKLAQKNYDKAIRKAYKSRSDKSDIEKKLEKTIEELENFLEDGYDSDDEIESQLISTKKKLNKLKIKLCEKDINQELIRELDDAKKEMAKVVAYCIQDSALVIDLIVKLNVWVSLLAFSGVVGVTIEELFTRGQQVRCQSQIYDECYKKDIVLDKREKVTLQYSGGYVPKPIVGLHDNIIGLDFNSLYPNIIIRWNICYTTMLEKENWGKYANKTIKSKSKIIKTSNNIERIYKDKIIYGTDNKGNFIYENGSKIIKDTIKTIKEYGIIYEDDNKTVKSRSKINEYEIYDDIMYRIVYQTDDNGEILYKNDLKLIESKSQLIKDEEIYYEIEDNGDFIYKNGLKIVKNKRKIIYEDKIIYELNEDNEKFIKNGKILTNNLDEEEQIIYETDENGDFMYDDVYAIKFSQEEFIIPPKKVKEPGAKGVKDISVNENPLDDSDSDSDEEDEFEKLKKLKSKKDAPKHTVFYEYRFVKPHIKKGILPILLERLISERKKTRADLKMLGIHMSSINKMKEMIDVLESAYSSGMVYKDVLSNNKENINIMKNKISKEKDPKKKSELRKELINFYIVKDFLEYKATEYFIDNKPEGKTSVEVFKEIIADQLERFNKLPCDKDSDVSHSSSVSSSIHSSSDSSSFHSSSIHSSSVHSSSNNNTSNSNTDNSKNKKENNTTDNTEENKKSEREEKEVYENNNFKVLLDYLSTDNFANKIENDDLSNLSKKRIKGTKDKIIKEYEKWIKFYKNVNTYESFIEEVNKLQKYTDLNETVLDKKQLAIKVSANSMYGYLGAQKTGLMPLIEAALCVTALGRISIKKVNHYAITNYNATLIYGDTDSSFLCFGIKDPKDCHYWGHKMEDEINGIDAYTDDDGVFHEEVIGLFTKPMKIEFEKGMRICCICPKKYAYIEIEKDGEFERDDSGELVLNKKGILLARRDNIPLVRRIYKELLMMIMMKDTSKNAFAYLIGEIIEFLKGNVPITDLTVTRGIGANYKQDGYFIKVFAGELARMGNPVEPGDRVSSLIVKTVRETQGIKVPLGEKMRLPEMYKVSLECHANPEKFTAAEKEFIYPLEQPDILYYLGHSFMNPLDQLFEVGFKDLEKYPTIGYQPVYGRCNFAPIKTPIKMIVKLIEDFFKFYVKNGIEKTDSEKYAHISEVLEDLPYWSEKGKKKIDRMSGGS